MYIKTNKLREYTEKFVVIILICIMYAIILVMVTKGSYDLMHSTVIRELNEHKYNIEEVETV